MTMIQLLLSSTYSIWRNMGMVFITLLPAWGYDPLQPGDLGGSHGGPHRFLDKG